MRMANIPLTIKKRVSQKLMDKDEICDTLFAFYESVKFPVDREYPIDTQITIPLFQRCRVLSGTIGNFYFTFYQTIPVMPHATHWHYSAPVHMLLHTHGVFLLQYNSDSVEPGSGWLHTDHHGRTGSSWKRCLFLLDGS